MAQKTLSFPLKELKAARFICQNKVTKDAICGAIVEISILDFQHRRKVPGGTRIKCPACDNEVAYGDETPPIKTQFNPDHVKGIDPLLDLDSLLKRLASIKDVQVELVFATESDTR